MDGDTRCASKVWASVATEGGRLDENYIQGERGCDIHIRIAGEVGKGKEDGRKDTGVVQQSQRQPTNLEPEGAGARDGLL